MGVPGQGEPASRVLNTGRIWRVLELRRGRSTPLSSITSNSHLALLSFLKTASLGYSLMPAPLSQVDIHRYSRSLYRRLVGFLKVQCLVGVSHEIGRGAQGDSCGATEVRSPWTWRGGAPHCSRVMVGESSLKTLRRRTLEVFLGVWQETLGSLDLCP